MPLLAGLSRPRGFTSYYANTQRTAPRSPLATRYDVTALQQRLNSALADLSSTGDMRPGSLVRRYIKCSTPTLLLLPGMRSRPWPQCLPVHNADGKRNSRSIPADTSATVEARLDAYRRFRSLTAAFLDICEWLADARLPSKGSSARSTGKRGFAQQFGPDIEADARFVAPGTAGSAAFEALETRLRQRALRARPFRGLLCRGGRVQDCDGIASEAVWYALDRQWCQCCRCPALLSVQRGVRGLLGAEGREPKVFEAVSCTLPRTFGR